MANWKSRSDDEIAWASKSGNRGKTYPGEEMARKQNDRDKAAGENNLSAVRNFLFGKSDARKQKVEDAVNARRDAGTPMKLEPYVSPKSIDLDDSSFSLKPKISRIPKKTLFTNGVLDLGPSDRDASEYPKEESGVTSLKESKGGKISLKDCKVTTHAKNKKQPNW